MTGKLRLGNVVVVEELRSADSRPRVGAFTITDAVVREFSVADWVEAGRQLGAFTVEFSERRDEDGYMQGYWSDTSHHPGIYLIFELPVESPTPKEGEQ